MNKRLTARMPKFGSLLSLLALGGMFLLFAFALPEFFVSPAGRVFAGIWAVLAIAGIWAHAVRLSDERRRRYMSAIITGKSVHRKRKEQHHNSLLRG